MIKINKYKQTKIRDNCCKKNKKDKNTNWRDLFNQINEFSESQESGETEFQISE